MRDRRRSPVAAIVVLAALLAAPGPSASYSEPEEVRDVAAHSELIVLAHVVSGVSSEGKPTIAYATVEETWKGPTHEHIRFVASPSWPCDAAEAVKDETVVLFLSEAPGNAYSISANGRGRLPLRDINGVKYVTIWDDFILPLDTPMVPGPVLCVLARNDDRRSESQRDVRVRARVC